MAALRHDAVLNPAGFRQNAYNLVIALDDNAEALAQFLKQADPEGYRRRAGLQKEAAVIEDVALILRKVLEGEGFAPK